METNQIKIKNKEVKSYYSNSIQIVHSENEFILDFLLSLPHENILSSRIIINPNKMKKIIKLLQENLLIYEKEFGKIEILKKVKKTNIKKKMGFNNK